MAEATAAASVGAEGGELGGEGTSTWRRQPGADPVELGADEGLADGLAPGDPRHLAHGLDEADPPGDEAIDAVVERGGRDRRVERPTGGRGAAAGGSMASRDRGRRRRRSSGTPTGPRRRRARRSRRSWASCGRSRIRAEGGSTTASRLRSRRRLRPSTVGSSASSASSTSSPWSARGLTRYTSAGIYVTVHLTSRQVHAVGDEHHSTQWSDGRRGASWGRPSGHPELETWEASIGDPRPGARCSWSSSPGSGRARTASTSRCSSSTGSPRRRSTSPTWSPAWPGAAGSCCSTCSASGCPPSPTPLHDGAPGRRGRGRRRRRSASTGSRC